MRGAFEMLLSSVMTEMERIGEFPVGLPRGCPTPPPSGSWWRALVLSASKVGCERRSHDSGLKAEPWRNLRVVSALVLEAEMPRASC